MWPAISRIHHGGLDILVFNCRTAGTTHRKEDCQHTVLTHPTVPKSMIKNKNHNSHPPPLPPPVHKLHSTYACNATFDCFPIHYWLNTTALATQWQIYAAYYRVWNHKPEHILPLPFTMLFGHGFSSFIKHHLLGAGQSGWGFAHHL